MSIAASGDGLSSSEDEDSMGLPPSGIVTSWQPCLPGQPWVSGLRSTDFSPEPSRLDDWFLGAGRGSQPRSAPVLFSRRCMRSWRSPGRALLRPEAAHLPPPSSLHLMCSESITWRNCPRLLSKACKLTAALAAKAYSAAGQAASAMHAMAILQVHQAKALKQMHECSTDHFSTGYTPKSRNGHGAAVQFTLPSRQRVPAHSAPAWTFSFYRSECP